MQVTPGARRNFYADEIEVEKHGCPALTDACRHRGYVMPGDLLVASQRKGAFTYATFVAAKNKRSTSGWIETAALRPVARPAAARPQDWIGDWRGDENDIEIRRTNKPGVYHIDGQATFGLFDPKRVKVGAINDGEFTVAIAIAGDELRFGVDDSSESEAALPYDAPDSEGYICKVHLRLLGPYLVAKDNNQCGGVNVSFTGIYRR